MDGVEQNDDQRRAEILHREKDVEEYSSSRGIPIIRCCDSIGYSPETPVGDAFDSLFEKEIYGKRVPVTREGIRAEARVLSDPLAQEIQAMFDELGAFIDLRDSNVHIDNPNPIKA